MFSTKSGKIQTVTGLLDPGSLGKTLTHEHLSMIFDVAYVPPKEKDTYKANAPFSLETIGWIRYNPYSHKPNLILNDSESEGAIFEELLRYKASGGASIVECTTHGLNRKADFLYELSKSTGINIIAGTGYYVAGSHEVSVKKHSLELLASVMESEITCGCVEASDVRCGIIGEIGCSWPLHSFEKTVLRAAAQIQNQLKCPVSIHPARNPNSPSESLRIFQEAGGNASQVALCHLDRTLADKESLLEFSKMGSFLEFDLFGIECSYYQLNDLFDMPSDAQRIDKLVTLIDEGYEDKLLISHDIHTKHRLSRYGGHGFSHILENIVPRMKKKNISETVINKILISNPSNWLTFG